MDKSCKLVIPYFDADLTYGFHDGYAIISKYVGRKDLPYYAGYDWAVINRSGKKIINYGIYDYIENIGHGLFVVRRLIQSKPYSAKEGYCNAKGEEIIPIKYDEAGDFDKENKAKVVLGGRSFWINKKGECVKDCPQ